MGCYTVLKFIQLFFKIFLGQFKVRWIYVKDVPNSQLRHIRLENNENKPVTNSRDTQVRGRREGRGMILMEI